MKWNMEKVTCFMSMTLQRSSELKGVGNIKRNIKRNIKQRILEWDENNFEILNSSTIIYA